MTHQLHSRFPPRPRAQILTSLDTELESFTHASPELLRQRALLQRVDTKFILPRDTLPRVLAGVQGRYALLTAAGATAAVYRTLYFDTEQYLCIREHHRGRRPRYKIRIRHYADRELSFLEIKKKTSANRTVKMRKPIPFLQEDLGEEERQFINDNTPIPASTLRPSLRTDFRRITLIGLDTMERATFDLDLHFGGAPGGADFPGAVIAEIKQDRFSARSSVMLALRQAGVLPVSVSKYCTAATLLLPAVPMNRYLPKLRSLRRVSCD